MGLFLWVHCVNLLVFISLIVCNFSQKKKSLTRIICGAASLHSDLYTYEYTSTCMHACMHALYTYAYTCMHACMHAIYYIYTFACTIYTYICMHYIHTNACMHQCMHYMQIHVRAYNKYIHIYIYISIYIYNA